MKVYSRCRGSLDTLQSQGLQKGLFPQAVYTRAHILLNIKGSARAVARVLKHRNLEMLCSQERQTYLEQAPYSSHPLVPAHNGQPRPSTLLLSLTCPPPCSSFPHFNKGRGRQKPPARLGCAHLLVSRLTFGDKEGIGRGGWWQCCARTRSQKASKGLRWGTALAAG